MILGSHPTSSLANGTPAKQTPFITPKVKKPVLMLDMNAPHTGNAVLVWLG